LERLKKLLLLIPVFLSNSQLIIAQKSQTTSETISLVNTYGEKIFLHCNNSSFVTGETIYYKLSCLKSSDNSQSNTSKIAYVELINSDKESVYIEKKNLENGQGQGDYFIPSTLKTGSYKIIAYTQFMLNFPIEDIFQMDIAILNPFQYNEIKLENENSLTNTVLAKNELLTLQISKQNILPREKVQVKLKLLDGTVSKGNYSLSVRKKDNLTTFKTPNAAEFVNNSKSGKKSFEESKKEILLPELRGEMIVGKIIAKNPTNSIQNKTVGFSIPGKSFVFKVANTDANGKFIINIDKGNYNRTVTAQVMNEKPEDYSISLETNLGIDYGKLSSFPEIEVKSNYKEILKNRSIANQVENAYFNKKADTIVEPKKINSFFESKEKQYILDNFTRFATLKENITEIVYEMYFKENNHKYSLHLRNYNNEISLDEPALVLVDGLLIQDVNQLFDYNMENVAKISIVTGAYNYGSEIYNGIINLTTKNYDYINSTKGDFLVKTDLLRPQNDKKYYNQKYEDPAKYKRIPDYRYQLLWEPNLSLNETENNVSFYTSDVSGEFEIVLEGFTEKGIPISVKENFEVK
jgi:hypothetical protein